MPDSQYRDQMGGNTILLGAAAASVNPYLIATEKGVLQYFEGDPIENQEGQIGLPVSVAWVGGMAGGMGEARKLSPETQGYWWSDGFDASQYGCVRLQPLQISVTPVNLLAADSPVYFFETTGYVYVISGRYIYKCSASGSTLTLHREIDMGSGALGGPPARWGTSGYTARYFVPAGASVKFWRLDTVGSEASVAFSPAMTLNEVGLTAADTTITVNNSSGAAVLDVAIIESERWLITAIPDGTHLTVTRGYAGTTAVDTHASGVAITKATGDTWTQDGTNYALAFARSNQGVLASLVRGLANILDVATTVVANEPVFGGDTEVGDSGSAIVKIADSGVSLFVGKQDNLYEVVAGSVRQLTMFPPDDKNANYGVGTESPAGTSACFYNHRGQYYWDGNEWAEVGPDTLPAHRNTTELAHANIPQGGEHFELAVAGRTHIYSVYRSISSGRWILVGKRGGGRIKWDTLIGISAVQATERGAFIDSGSRLWSAQTAAAQNRILFQLLAADGAPNAGPSSLGFGAISTSHNLYSPLLDFGYPHTLKQFRVVELYALDLDATTPLAIRYGLEGAAFSATALGTAITGTGLSKRFFSSAIEGYLIGFRFQCATTADYSSTDSTTDPRILSIIARAVLRPDLARQVKFTIQTDGPLGTGGGQQLDATEIRTLLLAMEGANPQAMVYLGNSLNLSVTKVNVRVKSHNPLAYFLDVEGVQFVTA